NNSNSNKGSNAIGGYTISRNPQQGSPSRDTLIDILTHTSVEEDSHPGQQQSQRSNNENAGSFQQGDDNHLDNHDDHDDEAYNHEDAERQPLLSSPSHPSMSTRHHSSTRKIASDLRSKFV